MLNPKNLSPKQLSAFTALVLSVPIALGFWFVRENWIITLVALIVTFLGSYLLIQFVLEWFIYRKIKLIYKFIYQTKANKREETYYKIYPATKKHRRSKGGCRKMGRTKKGRNRIIKNQ